MDHAGSSRYVDYAPDSPQFRRDPDLHPQYNGGYESPPPHRPRRTHRRERSHTRSRERLDEQRYDDRSYDRRHKSLDRLDHDFDRRSLEQLDHRGRSLDRLDRTLERSKDRIERRDKIYDRSLDRRVMKADRRSNSRDMSEGYEGQVYPSPRGGDVIEYGGKRREIEEEERRAASRAASEIYANTRFPRPHSQMSQYTYRSAKSGRSGRSGRPGTDVKVKTTAGGKLVMETMTAPHPCCPNTRSCCCLMILLNLGLLLITLGFVVVLQLYDPPFVWYIGLSMLIFGFMVMFGSLIYCVFVCREVERMRPPPGELYWNRHWSKSVHVPEIHYSNTQHRPADYRGSEFSYKTEPSRTTAGNHTASSMSRY